MANEFENLKLGTEEFVRAMKEATDSLAKGINNARGTFPAIAYDDLCPEYGGRMRINYCNGRGAWHDVMSVLIAHGYEVTLHTEVASEVEREMDGVDKWIVIEFGEVE